MSLAGKSKGALRRVLRGLDKKKRRKMRKDLGLPRLRGVCPLLVRGARGHDVRDPNPRLGKHAHSLRRNLLQMLGRDR